MSWYYLTKEFYDYADDIEGVNIHYLWTPLGGVPDWDNQRVTRFLPRVQPPLQSGSEVLSDAAERSDSTPPRLRRKILKLPQKIMDSQSSAPTDRYLLHHYFEIFQDGHRHYSSLYSEEIYTGADTPPATTEAANEQQTADVSSFTHTVVKNSTR